MDWATISLDVLTFLFTQFSPKLVAQAQAT